LASKPSFFNWEMNFRAACTGCGQTKEADAFGYRNKAAGRRHRRCKTCVAGYSRTHYVARKARYIAASRKNSHRRRRGLARLVIEYLRTHPCVDCGQDDPLVLDFDHVDPTKRRGTVYRLVHQGLSWATVETEIAKCLVRCANCHHGRTAQQFRWLKIEFAFGVAEPEQRVETPRQRRMRPSGLRLSPPVHRQNSVGEAGAVCVLCGQVKSLDAFHFRSKKAQSRHHVCAECFNAYRRKHYRLYRAEYVERKCGRPAAAPARVAVPALAVPDKAPLRRLW
jgi:hypothetical protein